MTISGTGILRRSRGTGSLAEQTTSDPGGITAAIEDGNHAYQVSIDLVVDGKWESLCQAAMRAENDTVDASDSISEKRESRK
jgi:hypothetical protein